MLTPHAAAAPLHLVPGRLLEENNCACAASPAAACMWSGILYISCQLRNHFRVTLLEQLTHRGEARLKAWALTQSDAHITGFIVAAVLLLFQFCLWMMSWQLMAAKSDADSDVVLTQDRVNMVHSADNIYNIIIM